MILRRLRIEGFGVLRGEWRFDATRVNLLVGENERGKTTLAAAVAGALYGLDTDRRSYRDRLTPHEQYRPWSGRPYALELEFDVTGRRYVVNRHFGNNRITVLEDGADVTESFRHGSGEYKLGEELLGMNVDQFARSALWLQPGVPRLAGESVRPDASLASLLERLASSVQGDASAAQALAVLDGALRNYRGVQQSGLVVNEIKKLEMALDADDVGLVAAGKERRDIAEDLARLAELEERERQLVKDLDAARAAGARGRLAELQASLAQDGHERSQLAAYRAEWNRLLPARHFPADAAKRLERAEAERKAAEDTLAALAADRERDVAAPRRDLARTAAELAAFAWAEPGHVEKLHALEIDLARAREQIEAARRKLRDLEGELARHGVALARLIALRDRFGGLAAEDRALLTHFPAQTESMIVEAENAQLAVSSSQHVLDAVGKQRGALRGWGFAGFGLGVAAGAVSVYFALGGQVPESFLGLGGTLLFMAAATLLLLRSASHRASERSDALRRMTDAQRRLGELRVKRREREEALGVAAKRLGFEEPVELRREYDEFLRLTDETRRMEWLTQDETSADDEARKIGESVAGWAERAGLPATMPADEALARLRQGVQDSLRAREREREIEAHAARIAAQEAVAQKRLADARAEMIEVARALDAGSGGSDPNPDPATLLARVEEQAKAHARLEALEREWIPAAEMRVLAPEVRAQREAEAEKLGTQLAAAVPNASAVPDAPAAPPGAPAVPARDPAALEARLEETRRARAELFGSVGLRDRDLAARVSGLVTHREELRSALARARAFRQAVELARERFQSVARETHAKWSEFLGRRVDELLPRLGLEHAGFRISEQLEMSLALSGERLTQARLDQALSAGARDQLALALRIAICEFLARGAVRLPLLLDDPLATADDARAARILETLREVARAGHQVLVLTCHRAKVEALRARDAAGFAGAVHLLEFAADPAVTE